MGVNYGRVVVGQAGGVVCQISLVAGSRVSGMKTLVTGGAGYIGSHVVRSLLRNGHEVMILDDLSTGLRNFVPEGAQFSQATLLDKQALRNVFGQFCADVVIHIAGFKFAGESVIDPLHTYEQNITGTWNLLEAMQSRSVKKVIFSSSSSVYGDAKEPVIGETHPKEPISPYGESKLVGEWMLNSMAVAHGFRVCSLRYFNVVGSSYNDLFDTSPHGLFSKVFLAVTSGVKPVIYGSDYPTSDGTCVRDYIPVGALADAHVVAAEKLAAGEALEPAYNLGTGTGHTVAEVMKVMAEVTGISFEPELVARRPGDPATVVASGDLARRDLGWDPQTNLREMVHTAWRAYQSKVASS